MFIELSAGNFPPATYWAWSVLRVERLMAGVSSKHALFKPGRKSCKGNCILPACMRFAGTASVIVLLCTL